MLITLIMLTAGMIFQSYDNNRTEMFRLALFAFLLTFVALSYSNPTGDLFKLEEEIDDYADYEQSGVEHRGARRTCEGRIELLSNGDRRR